MGVMAVGALIAGSAGSGRSMAQGLETETIKGAVVNSITHEPIGRALVFSLDNRFAMLCDAGGHFEFRIPRQTCPPHCWRESRDSLATKKHNE
jgi:hypothetical protein